MYVAVVRCRYPAGYIDDLKTYVVSSGLLQDASCEDAKFPGWVWPCEHIRKSLDLWFFKEEIIACYFLLIETIFFLLF